MGIMKLNHLKSLALVFIAFTTLASSAENNVVENLTWKKTSTAKVVKIDNPLGDIRLRFGGYNDEFELIGMIQHIENIGTIEVSETIEDDIYSLSVKRIDKSTGQYIDVLQNDKARIDYTVFIPQGRKIYANTRSGLLDVRKMKDPVILSSDSGNIYLRDNQNTVSAQTNSGEIVGNLVAIESKEKQVFETSTGPIDIWISEQTKQTVTMATSGDIISEFSTKITRNMNQEPNKKAVTKPNGGGPLIEAKSKRGVIALRTYPEMEKSSHSK
jgi:hypothetical protein